MTRKFDMPITLNMKSYLQLHAILVVLYTRMWITSYTAAYYELRVVIVYKLTEYPELYNYSYCDYF